MYDKSFSVCFQAEKYRWMSVSEENEFAGFLLSGCCTVLESLYVRLRQYQSSR